MRTGHGPIPYKAPLGSLPRSRFVDDVAAAFAEANRLRAALELIERVADTERVAKIARAALSGELTREEMENDARA